MKVVVLLLALCVFFVHAHTQAQKLSGIALCGACSFTAQKIAGTLRKNPELRNVLFTPIQDVQALRSTIESQTQSNIVLRIQTIFSVGMHLRRDGQPRSKKSLRRMKISSHANYDNVCASTPISVKVVSSDHHLKKSLNLLLSMVFCLVAIDKKSSLSFAGLSFKQRANCLNLASSITFS